MLLVAGNDLILMACQVASLNNDETIIGHQEGQRLRRVVVLKLDGLGNANNFCFGSNVNVRLYFIPSSGIFRIQVPDNKSKMKQFMSKKKFLISTTVTLLRC